MKFEEYKKINERAFDFLSEKYARKGDSNSVNILIRKFYGSLLKKDNPSLLEIGIGSGDMLRYFSEQGIITTGIDISKKMIKVAKRNSLDTNFIHSDFLSYDFNCKNFDGIFADFSLHLFPREKMEEVFEKVYSILKEKSYFYFSIPMFDKSSEEIIRRGEDQLFLEFRTKYCQNEIEELISKTKFILLEESIRDFIDSKKNNQLKLNALFTKKC